MILRQFVVVAGVARSALLGRGAAPAAAHPNAIQSTPEAGSVAPESPKAISIALSEPAVARGSTFEVTGPGGKAVATGPVTEKANGQILSVVPRKPLASAVMDPYATESDAQAADAAAEAAAGEDLASDVVLHLVVTLGAGLLVVTVLAVWVVRQIVGTVREVQRSVGAR